MIFIILVKDYTINYLIVSMMFFAVVLRHQILNRKQRWFAALNSLNLTTFIIVLIAILIEIIHIIVIITLSHNLIIFGATLLLFSYPLLRLLHTDSVCHHWNTIFIAILLSFMVFVFLLFGFFLAVLIDLELSDPNPQDVYLYLKFLLVALQYYVLVY